VTTLAGEPLTVHCEKCGHERELGHFPMPVDVFAALGKLPCAACGSKKVFLGKQPKPTNDGDAVGWLLNGDTGISSQTIWSVMMGKRINQSHWYADVPHDPSDFGRCYRLLKVMPSWRARLPEVAAKYKAWKPLVDAWDELTALYEEELPNGTAPKLYRRMEQLRGLR
jgi:hypothetical protein